MCPLSRFAATKLSAQIPSSMVISTGVRLAARSADGVAHKSMERLLRRSSLMAGYVTDVTSVMQTT